MINRKLLDVAYERASAEKIITNGQLVNVYTGEIYPADVAIEGGQIAAIGQVENRRGPKTEIIDARGMFLTPGLIDGHLHIECSKLSVAMFGHLVSRYGTTSAISGLDQILVSTGLSGVREALDEAKQGNLRVFWGAPAKAPYTVPESNVGQRFGITEHRIAQNWEECYGIWETVQEFIEEGDEEVLAALDLAEKNRLRTFGCAPISDARRIAGLAAAGFALDHESYSPEEELEKLRNGICILIRQSTAAPFLKENIKLITEMKVDSDKIAFCTDDVSASEVLENGHLDALVRQAIEEGVAPVKAIQMATINCAKMYQIDRYVGSITPGRFADILFVEDLNDFKPTKVMAGGKIVAENGKNTQPPVIPERSPSILKTFKRKPITAKDLEICSSNDRETVLSMTLSDDVAFVRTRSDITLPVKNGVIEADTQQDTLFVTVVERYGKTTNSPVGFVTGFGLKKGAIATSASPDDNNIVCVGATREDMTLAINTIIKSGGGQVVVADGEVIDCLELPIAGIVADTAPEEMARHEQQLNENAIKLGSTLKAPFWYLMFLSITSIPDYAITDLGLVDCRALEIIDPIH